MSAIHVFGEVLYDCFPGGEQVLGGAPFNVAWHLQALGDAPRFISRVGQDALGDQIVGAMRDWGMDLDSIQRDAEHATGKVQIEIAGGEPAYDICYGVAYDYIDAALVPSIAPGDILYHGSLALRAPDSRSAWHALVEASAIDIFMDVNLRDPWWQVEAVKAGLRQAHWAKMNGDELAALGYPSDPMEEGMKALQEELGVPEVIVTRGKRGALVRTSAGELLEIPPPPLEKKVDTVGAGDAFSAVYLHGVRAGWPRLQTMDAAQRFANGIIGQRGATPSDDSFYTRFKEMCGHV